MEQPIGRTITGKASDGGLEIQLELGEGVELERVPMRKAWLRFKNISERPLRIYLPASEQFRCNISSLSFFPEGAPPLFVPVPRPHGYVVTEKDFHLIAQGKEASFAQRFTIDPFPPGGGEPQRLAGFEPGKKIVVRWIYENRITEWKGGVETLDGPTRRLIDGEAIPDIWIGKVTVKLDWWAPPLQ